MSALAPLPPTAFWCRIPSRPNFGDALTPWLIRRLTGHYPRFAMHDHPAPKLFVTGSIAGLAGPGDTVWGCGIMQRDEPLAPGARWLAVRGPRTRQRALACGADCPAVLGDPGLLLPRLYTPPAVQRRGIGLVPHFADRARLDTAAVARHGLRLIDIQQDIESVVDQVVACEWLMSSSLHGLIVAHAYGIPALWVRLWELPSGDGSKFADHYEALGQPSPAALPLCLQDRVLPLAQLARQAWCPGRIEDDALWRSCPLLDHER
ncbi:polysaccharide pyruvyl transferase family protein [Eleftheria terrae]|uniref:polysaccharide pyruvyl transferase family protein n=1 Tax=Eleftheria terrae TaxID=1597781 RepID=UPI00263B991E|nr:polysaccharide pyruvyl transferase family protein [Eleftheria terrae]WKB55804.1 polysaccharide pyruvyl transferase family protein [Eleftheria terrae]